MVMNSTIHLKIKTETFKRLKEEANENQISLSALCRLKICKYHRLNKLEFMLEKLLRRKR
jgi:hypothetical protein